MLIFPSTLRKDTRGWCTLTNVARLFGVGS